VELVYALGRIITDLPGLLSRRVDPRAAFSVVWGSVQAGQAGNAIPSSGVVRGTIRLLDRSVWDGAEDIVRTLVQQRSCRLEPTRRSTIARRPARRQRPRQC
jgi:amidohydrolase